MLTRSWYSLAVGAPSYDAEVLAEYFQPLGEAVWRDATLGPLLRRWTESDPDLIAAVADVDRSQVRDALAQTPDTRLRIVSQLAATFARANRVG